MSKRDMRASPAPPAITRDAIMARLKMLAADKDRLQANIYAIEGAIQDCQFWLRQFDVSKPEPN